VELYLHSPICFNVVVLNELGTGKILPYSVSIAFLLGLLSDPEHTGVVRAQTTLSAIHYPDAAGLSEERNRARVQSGSCVIMCEVRGEGPVQERCYDRQTDRQTDIVDRPGR
jgi:hypothetical protein